jgi:heptosyltransferase-2
VRNNPSRILVVAPSWIGDTVAAQPLFMRLHERHPGLQLDVMAPSYVAPVLRRMAEVARVIDNPFGHGERRLGDRWRLARELARARYDEAIVLPNSLKSALVPFFAGIPQRIGFVGEARRGLLNRVHKLDERALPQIAERYAQLAEAPGTPLPRPLPRPRLRVDERARQATLVALGLRETTPAVALCPGAEYGPAKRWPAEYFAQLARQLRRRGYAVCLIGSAKDVPVGAQIAAAARECGDLCGRTSLDQAIELLAASQFVVTNDSGLMHVAAALDRPLLALYGSSSPGYTPPLSDRAEVLSLGIDCSPCFKRECPLGHFRCMRDITPEQVLATILPRLPAAAPDAAAPAFSISAR